MGMGRYQFNVLAYWREGSARVEEEAPNDPGKQNLAWRLSAAGSTCIKSVLSAVHCAHGYPAVGMTDNRPERDQLSLVQQTLRHRYRLWCVFYPPGADGDKLTAMQNGLRQGAQEMDNGRASMAEAAPDFANSTTLTGPDDTGLSHYTGELYVPGRRVTLGHLWIPEELETLARGMPQPHHPPALPQMPYMAPGPQQPLHPPYPMPPQQP